MKRFPFARALKVLPARSHRRTHQRLAAPRGFGLNDGPAAHRLLGAAARKAPPPLLEACPPMLSSGLARLAVIEPGRQRVNFEVLASRTCIDGGTRFSADAITVTAMTEAGEDVVERVSTSLERGDRHLVELDVPRTAQRVTLVLAVEPTIGVLRQTVAVAALIEPTFRPRDPGAARLLPFEGSRLVCVGFDQV